VGVVGVGHFDLQSCFGRTGLGVAYRRLERV